jgi:type IV pilus assembly protein PilB
MGVRPVFSQGDCQRVRKKIGECLIQAGLITEADLQTALAEHKRSGERLGAVLVRMNLATERQIAKALAYQLGFSYVNLTERAPDPTAVVLIPKEVALKRTCLAIGVEKNLLTVAMSDPLLFTLVQDLEFQTGYRIKQVVSTKQEILDAIHSSYPDKALARLNQAGSGIAVQVTPPSAQQASEATSRGGMLAPIGDQAALAARRVEEDVFETASNLKGATPETAPIIDLVDLVIKSALKSRASDIHIEPTENNLVVRHRLDGLLKEVMDLPKWVHEGFVARMKIMGGMDIAEKRLPQDGRIRASADDGQEVDFRASTLRTIFGEKIVLRVLDNRKGVPPLEELGFSATSLEQIRFFLRHQHGMILVVGPTGSGKTTTLCSALTSVRSERTNIITIEDPVEYQIPGVNQTQINDKIKLTFASALRSILRQDPDVVLVGEIRDQETARIAMQAAQTGHLVLSTLHTDDAPSCVTRLTDIGIEPYVSASALIGVIAQRLMRRLCMHCRRPYTPDAETLRAMSVTEMEAATLTFYRAVGCDQCNHTGYRGRVGIYEIMHVSDKLRRMIAQRGSEAQLRDAAVSGGMVSLGEDGLLKVKAGVTTPDELLRVVTEVRETRSLCPQCGAGVSAEFAACPSCGHRVGGGCPHCGKPLQSGWRFCPYCAKSAEGTPSRRPRKLRDQRQRRELPAATNVAEFKK